MNKHTTNTDRLFIIRTPKENIPIGIPVIYPDGTLGIQLKANKRTEVISVDWLITSIVRGGYSASSNSLQLPRVKETHL